MSVKVMNKNTNKSFEGNNWHILLLPVITIIAGFIIPFIFGEDNAYVYSWFIAFSIVFGFLLNSYNNRSNICLLLLLLLITYLTVFIGCRDFGVGTDTLVYIDDYWDKGRYVHSIGDFFDFSYISKAFLLLSVIGHLFSDDHQSLLILTALTINAVTFLSVYIFNYKKLQINWVVYIVIWQFLLMNTSMNLMRQYCALAFMQLALVLFLKRKYFWAILSVVIGYQFHSTVLVLGLMGLFYLFGKYFEPKKRNILTFIVLLLLIIATLSAFKYISLLITGDYINEHFDLYTDNSVFESHNLFGVSYLTFSFLFVFSTIYLRQKRLISNNETYLLITLYSTAFILRLTGFSLVYLSRLSDSYNCFIYLILAYLLTKFSNRIPFLIQFMIYTVIFYSWFSGYILNSGAGTYPYHSVILNI